MLNTYFPFVKKLCIQGHLNHGEWIENSKPDYFQVFLEFKKYCEYVYTHRNMHTFPTLTSTNSIELQLHVPLVLPVHKILDFYLL